MMSHVNFHSTSVSPRQFIVSRNTTTMELQRVILSCHVSANPKPVVRWLKRTAEQIQVLTNSSRVLVTTDREGNAFSYRSTVLIRSILSIDSGEYMCEAENSIMISALPIISPTIFVTVNGELKKSLNLYYAMKVIHFIIIV